MSKKKRGKRNQPEATAEKDGEITPAQYYQYSQTADNKTEVAVRPHVLVSRRKTHNTEDVDTTVSCDNLCKLKNNRFLSVMKLIFSGSLFLLLLMILLSGCFEIRPPSEREVAKKEVDLEPFNLKRGRWWHYYNRGLFYLSHGRNLYESGSRSQATVYYSEAIDNFKIAIQKRKHDKRDARTYGMHFIDYFPHRESGVAYCLMAELETRDMNEKEKKFRDAIRQLNTSIEQAPSSKAKFYLKRATSGLWRTTRADVEPPTVWIENDTLDRWKDVPTLHVNGYSATLEVSASDGNDQSGIDQVWVDKKGFFVESAEDTFTGEIDVIIDPRDRVKTVAVNAVDFAGNISESVTVRLIVDTSPPKIAIMVQPDQAKLLGGRIYFDVNAVDDQGLRSVSVGSEPYERRDCRGTTDWDGRFFAESGIKDLPIRVTDLAGNISTVSVTLESRSGMGDADHGGRLLAYNSSVNLSQSLRNGYLSVIPQVSIDTMGSSAQFLPTGTAKLLSLSAFGNAQEPTSHERKIPDPKFEFPEFELRDTPVETSYGKYLLQGQVVNTRGLKYESIVVKVNDQETDEVEVLVSDNGDCRSFSAWIPLPDCNMVDCNIPCSIDVNACFLDPNTGRKFYPNETGLNVKRVQDRLWVPEHLYSVTLLPLEDVNEYNEKYGDDFEKANNWVLDALKRNTEATVRGQSQSRFDCNQIKRWKHKQIEQKLDDYYQKISRTKGKVDRRRKSRDLGDGDTELPQRASYLAQKASDLAAACETDLAIYGFFNTEYEHGSKMFEVKIGFTDVNSYGKHLLRPDELIDIYGTDRERNYYIDGLVSKLKTEVPRIKGRIIKVKDADRTIEVKLDREFKVFENIDLQIYDVQGHQGNVSLIMLCEATAKTRDVYTKHLNAKVQKCPSWDKIVKKRKEDKEVWILSK